MAKCGYRNTSVYFGGAAPSPEFENVVRLMIASDYVAQLQSQVGAEAVEA